LVQEGYQREKACDNTIIIIIIIIIMIIMIIIIIRGLEL